MIPLFQWPKQQDDFEVLRRLDRSLVFNDQEVNRTVNEIVTNVRSQGDAGLCAWIEKYEGRKVTSSDLVFSRKQMNQAIRKVSPEVRGALQKAFHAISRYHRAQKKVSSRRFQLQTAKGIRVGQEVRPLKRVAIYVPGGKASYPSTVLMNAVPAKVAGVSEIVLLTPNPDPAVLFAATLVGIKEIYICGGAQAIAAAAFGTETIPPVDKIVGPGNRYVAAAKRQVFGVVDIDQIAGPSEVAIIADAKANPQWLAWDLMAQAEHDEWARCFLITSSSALAKSVQKSLEELLVDFPRREIAEKSLREHGAIFTVSGLRDAAKLIDQVAPEHLQICLPQPRKFLKQIENYGAAFLGSFTPEAAGDYTAGPSHVLPTGSTARFASPLGVDDFLKRSSVIEYNRQGLQRDRQAIEALAEAEGLPAHARSVLIRFESID